MDIVDMIILVVECTVIGFGMALGDWVCKIMMVRWLNRGEGQIHDVEDDEEDEEETKKKKRRRRAASPSGAPLGVW